jgi:PucR family transcriptional regulator, purine catabolism regulatory protein
MLTLQTLIDELGLELAVGDAAGVAVRSVHSTELPDPTHWLSGGELLLTTGAALADDEAQRDFIERLVSHRIASLGFGTGLHHERVPVALLAAARAADFPVFEVPYEVPFIAITERAFAHLVNDRLDALERSNAIQARLERLVLDGRGLEEVVQAVAEAVGARVLVLSPSGEVMAAHPPEPSAEDLSDAHAALRESAAGGRDASKPSAAGETLALPVAQGERGAPQAWLIGLPEQGAMSDFQRLMLAQTVTVVALELMRLRVQRDTERRLAGDVLAEALTGRLHAEELEARLRPFGIGDQAAVLVFALDDPGAAAPALEQALAQAGPGGLVAARGALLCAVVNGGDLDPIELAGRMREELRGEHAEVRAAASRRAGTSSVRRSFHEARCALEAVRLANGNAPAVASHRDLGAFQLLLGVQDDEALRSYCDGVLGAIGEGDSVYGDELLRSLEVFIDHNGQWEKAARELYCHRHTLRYRIRRVEELTERDLSSARDRVEMWLALRGRELLR